MLVLTMISSDCRLPGHSLQLDRELQSASHQLAHAPYKQILSLAKTCDKLGIAVWEYLGSRFKVAGHAHIEPLDHYVRTRIQPA